MKVIYDIGANNGDDIPYYLLKGDRVVAVEANPSLCKLIGERFHKEVASGRLIIENCVVTASQAKQVDFYISKQSHVLSQMPEPDPKTLHLFTKVKLPGMHICEIIERHGRPYYVKIDIEHLDSEILNSMFDGKIIPDYISAESHNIEVLSTLICKGRYNSFKLVDGATVSQSYANRSILSIHDKEHHPYSFPHHSAGPFGCDIDGDWMNANSFFRYLAIYGLGWKDIHATRCHEPDITDLTDSHVIQILKAKQEGRRLILHRAGDS